MKHHSVVVFLLLVSAKSFSKVIDDEKIKFCSKLNCPSDDVGSINICGIRAEGGGFRLKQFENECELLKYGCNVDEAKAYGLINGEYCDILFGSDYEFGRNMKNGTEKLKNDFFELNDTQICGVCDNNDNEEVCGIRGDGIGFRIRIFKNYCELTKHNCENNLQFIKTDLFICKADTNISNYIINNNAVNENLNNSEITNNNSDKYEVSKKDKKENLIVVNSKIFGDYVNINDSIDTFFAASHVFDLPLKEIPLNSRRMWLKNAGPVKVFVPWISKPVNISNDTFHRPTLSSCYHKCPFKCPDTYAPVCGVPGVVAREPSLMFQNHCFMDVAQCKMFWENKSSTSHSSSYVESSFLFCMGDEMNAVYRFMPTIRTLQHMGRLKKKGKFRAILRNFRFVSEFRYGRPKFMG